MKKTAIIASALAGLFLLGCTKGDYGIKPSDPIHYDAPEAIAISDNVTVTPVTAIVIGEQTENDVVVAPFKAELPEGQTLNYVKLTLTATEAETPVAYEFELAEDGKVAKADLQTMVTTDYGKDLIARPYKAGIAVSVIAAGVANIKTVEIGTPLMITPTSESWGLVGSIKGFGWEDDAELRNICPGVWVSDVVEIEGEFKLRFGRAWAVNRGGTFAAAGHPFEVANNGANISVPAGKYQVVFREAADQVIVNPVTGWGLVGAFAGTNWGWDLFLGGDNYSEFFAIEKGVDTQVKLRLAASWETEKHGGTFVDYDSVVTPGSDNIVLTNADENKVVRFMYNGAHIIPCTPEWALIGQVEGSNWDWDYPMYETAAGIYTGIYNIDGQFKLRPHCKWVNDKGGVLVSPGEPFATSGDNIAVPEAGRYKVVYDTVAGTITVSKAE